MGPNRSFNVEYFTQFSSVKQDLRARSLSFNFHGRIATFSRAMLAEMKRISELEGKNLRVSIHSGPECELHNMVILQHRSTYNRPHYHKTKSECYHLLEGKQTAFVFDDSGKVIDRCEMSMEGNLVYRFEKSLYHMTIPTSDFVMFHESKKGPFIREGDSLFASWGPDGEKAGEAKAFTASLLQRNKIP